MTDKQGERHQVGAAARAVFSGAGVGMVMGVVGTLWSARGRGVSVDWPTLESQTLMAVSAGAVIGLVLHLTKDYRTRGLIQHYSSWMLASVVAALVLVIPAAGDEGWIYTLLFALWIGAIAGLGLGVAARQVNRPER